MKQSDDLDRLPATFAYSEAMAAGLTKHRLYELRFHGEIKPIARGLYRKAEAPESVDLDLIEIAKRAPRATLCLTTALVRHDLTDANPAMIDVAIPERTHRPVVTPPVSWHRFEESTFDVGRETQQLDSDIAIGIYGPMRCIIDAFRLSYREGDDLAHIALRRWLRRRGSSPSALIAMTESFPTAVPAITRALEIVQHE